MLKLMKLIEKYKDIIPYGIFGVLTTVINIVVYWFFSHIMELSVMSSTILAWFFAVLFAYVTNRKWVFGSQADNTISVIKEMISFFACRLATGFVDWGCMFLFVNILNLDDIVIKTIANIIVIILNYVASKFIIFKKPRKNLP